MSIEGKNDNDKPCTFAINSAPAIFHLASGLLLERLSANMPIISGSRTEMIGPLNEAAKAGQPLDCDTPTKRIERLARQMPLQQLESIRLAE
jgi:hypothetical protein